MTIGRTKPLAAFTLIELLIVVAIITLLISILAPIGQEALRKTNRLKCAANMKNIVITPRTIAAAGPTPSPTRARKPTCCPTSPTKAAG